MRGSNPPLRIENPVSRPPRPTRHEVRRPGLEPGNRRGRSPMRCPLRQRRWVPPQGLEPCSSRIKSPVPVHPGVSGAEKARVELARRLPPLVRFRDGCRHLSACFSKAEDQGFEPCRDVTAAYAISNGAPRPAGRLPCVLLPGIEPGSSRLSAGCPHREGPSSAENERAQGVH